MKVKKLALISILIALYCVLAYLASLITTSYFKFTLEALPILIAGMLMGPIEGLTVGALGSFLIQIMTYGITPTTILWILPHALSGLVVGLLAKHYNYEIDTKRATIISIISALLVTVFNTLALYVDSKAYGYYSKELVFLSIPLKIVLGVVTAFLFSLILKPLLNSLKRFTI